MRRAVLALVAQAGLEPEAYEHLDVLAILTAVEVQVPDRTGFRAAAEAALVRIELAACEGAAEAPGARETLAWLLDRGVRVGIVTRNSRQAVERVLQQIPLPYEVLLTRADTPRVKPDPLHLHRALKRLEVPPGAAVMVGDHLMDVQGGKAAGMRALGILTDERPPDYFDAAAPDGVIRHLPELRRWISP